MDAQKQEKVERFLAAVGREPDEIVANYYTYRRVVTLEKVAINAVMAGCLPEYFPVVLAIVESIAIAIIVYLIGSAGIV